MNLPSLVTYLFPPSAKDKQKLELACSVLKTLHQKKFRPRRLLRLARKNDYSTHTLVRIVRTCRTRRQRVLHGAYVQRFLHPMRSFGMFVRTFLMQSEMEKLFLKLFRESGDEEMLETIKEARFVTDGYVEKLRIARKEFLAEFLQDFEESRSTVIALTE
jgi:hypothetical protein